MSARFPANVQHRVADGETVSSIALAYGFRDPKVIWNHPENAELKKKRKSPDVLHPGDMLVIPQKKVKKVPVPTGKSHRFEVKRAPARVLRIAFVTAAGEPLANAEYTLYLAGKEIEGETDGDGVLEQEVPHNVASATVLIDGDEHNLYFGLLNPVRETPDDGWSGARSRLQNLGYDVDSRTTAPDARAQKAIAAFQRDHGMNETGELDDATRDRLLSEHGS